MQEGCPCHLAETNECILCSQLRGCKFCDCINWKGVCIYQEYIWNGNKAKEGRKEFECKIINKTYIEKNLLKLTILIPHKLSSNLVSPGSFVFLRTPDSDQFYNTPISIMDLNLEENLIQVAIEIKGIKTKKIDSLNEGENILVKGPFWNGVQGLKNIYKSKDKTSIVVIRGIGQAPSIPVIKKLYSNGNNLIVIVDKGNFSNIFIREHLEKYNCNVFECQVFEKGELTDEFKDLLTDLMENREINLIHVAAQDILIYKILNYVENPEIKFSCCNNAKMCCGEGICGGCTARYKGHKIKRLCKVQTDPRNLFEGRRFI
ncbi:sulfide/dihydroorotate dehydrogenase-like FAD/NAD-binding protein [Haloimpatiens sp. FM7330]|uniref:sulfide/dihydroorotate dehydrogenase-like FAD/NAD-binding protein n=1 Tax=Haloimpatiens sp. FM7330 TaxID=3298610 RepID=UPI00362B290D